MQNRLGVGNQITQDLKRPLSPIPDVHEELDLFMISFGKFSGLPDEEVKPAFMALKAKRYSPFVLADKELNIKRIGELTSFKEGDVLGLRKFADDWVERQKSKRARYN